MRASPLVWAVWGILTVCGLAFVAAYGRNCPFMDEWEFVDALGPDTDLLRWAFAPHGEHRYPVPRLVYAGLFRLTGDLRTAMVANVLSLSAAAALLIRAARRA
ncbi:MAG: hypothetical protein K2P78_00175, partial [Gemmataceae bacterium]|nr:hypothetical protein [Gemmataceae bacterium]